MKTDYPLYSTIHDYVKELQEKNKSSFLSVIQKNGTIKSYSSMEYFEQIMKLAKSLGNAGVKKGDKVAILSNTRHEWSVCDLAIISLGAIVIPLYPNTTADELEYILNHSETKVIFLENKLNLRQQLFVKDRCPQLKNIIVFDPPSQPEPGVWLSFSEFLAGSAHDGKEHSFNFEKQHQQTSSEDIVTIIYTSGTTGVPKGVVLSHRQIIAEITEAFSALQMTPKDRTLSFLPYSHVLGRTEHWGHLILGFHMTYSSGIEKLSEELIKVEPTIIIAVPRVFEKLYTILKSKVDTSMIDSKLFDWAYKVGSQASQQNEKKEQLDYKLKIELALAQKLLLNRLKEEVFGKNLRFAICGGAPLSTEIVKFFHSCGILILEGYGLTETTGAICVNRLYDYEFGSVGKPLYKTKIKIASDGEILIQGPTTLKEYYKDPELTKQIIDKDWVHTGDIGEISKNGNLIIKDRKKDLIKTANGKYVAPQKIESLFKQLPYISYAHIHGDQKSYITALLTLNKNLIFSIAREQGIAFKSIEDLKEHPYIRDLVRSGVAQINLSLASHETIKNFAILNEDFSIEGGEITPSQKVKRKVIDSKFKAIIDSLY